MEKEEENIFIEIFPLSKPKKNEKGEYEYGPPHDKHLQIAFKIVEENKLKIKDYLFYLKYNKIDNSFKIDYSQSKNITKEIWEYIEDKIKKEIKSSQ